MFNTFCGRGCPSPYGDDEDEEDFVPMGFGMRGVSMMGRRVSSHLPPTSCLTEVQRDIKS